MKCRILFVVLSSVLTLSKAVTVDHTYYPQDNHHHHAHAHQTQVKYIEPAHVNTVKYIQPAPLIKHVAPEPVKYIQQEPQHVKYIHQEPQHVKYVHQDPHAVKYVHQDPHAVKYVHQDPHAVKYIDSPQYVKHVEYDEPANYEFGYDVHDSQTGDVKSHTEKRDGHSVHGRYEVLDPDGFKRIVEYTADEHGYNAVTRREPVDVKIIKKTYEPEVVKHIAPIAAPVAPVKYFSPQPEQYIHQAPKLFAPSVQQKVIAPIVKSYATPQYYAAPENPKLYGKPLEKITKIVKPAYSYEPQHTDVKYVQPQYNHYQ